MARSALIALFQRAYQSARVVTQPRHPLYTAKSQSNALLEAPLSRRQVLQAGIATAGLIATRSPSQPWLTPSDGAAEILVVGAGIAGLTTAYRLRQAGLAVDVIEASPRVGGRLRSLTHPSTHPAPVELGGEFIDTQHTHVRSLAAELGLDLADLKVADAGLEPEILYFGGQRVSHEAVIEAFGPVAEQIIRDLASLRRRDITYRDPSAEAQRLDRLSLAEYLDAIDCSALIKDLITVAYVTEFGRNADEQSCLNMLFLIGAEVGKWSTYGVSDERWHVIGGNERIPQALANRLEGAIALNTALESIRETSDRHYRVSLRQGNRSLERTYNQIVLTVPFSVLRQVELAVEMPPRKREAIAQLGYGISSKLAIPFQERIWRTRHGSTVSVYTDLAFQNTWESARYSHGPSGWLTNLRAGDQGLLLAAETPETHAHALVDDLAALFPKIQQVQRGQALRAIWAAEPYALGSYSCYLPGQWTQFAGVEAERIGQLWFAGEHCSLGSQGYMNGAVETAEAAARGILATRTSTVS